MARRTGPVDYENMHAGQKHPAIIPGILVRISLIFLLYFFINSQSSFPATWGSGEKGPFPNWTVYSLARQVIPRPVVSASGLRHSAFGLWPLAFGLRPLAVGLGPLALGLWPCAFGLWPLAFGLLAFGL